MDEAIGFSFIGKRTPFALLYDMNYIGETTEFHINHERYFVTSFISSAQLNCIRYMDNLDEEYYCAR
jgi:hypothetical protein